MTHTVHPYAHRLGIIRDWKNRWFASDKQNYRDNIRVDAAIRTFVNKRLRGMFVGDLEIERTQNEIRVIIHTARPGLVIGRSGENATKLRKEVATAVHAVVPTDKRVVKVDIVEIRQAETNAAVVAAMVAEGLEKRMPFRRILKQTVEKVMAVREVQGVRIVVSGRLGGAEMARREEIKRGRIPLQTFRADITFATEKAYLPYGVIGIKVWIYLGNIYPGAERRTGEPALQSAATRA